MDAREQIRNTQTGDSLMADGSDGIVIPFPSNNNIDKAIYQSDDSKPTKSEEFLSILANFAQIGVAIARNKNADYANSHDPFKNFKATTAIGVGPERAMLVRMTDKVSRISNLL